MLTKRLKVVALISGGKDSCYNMIQCVSEGHSIVALANLRPKDKDEADSYMFQTVGHHLIDLYGEAMGLPLYRRTLEGGSVEQGADYFITKDDEVEDLYELLREVKEKEGVNAVSVGAILSDYQRVRVENVCMRLGLTPLAYLWRRDQSELLSEMVAAGVEAILIKVAALGLDPHKHLGRTLAQIHPHMSTMEKKFGLNVCGEGGEYETFTLDCPLFTKRIVIDKQELVMHSDDPIAPVGYLNLLDAHLEDKKPVGQDGGLEQLQIMRSSDMVNELLSDVPPEQTNASQTDRPSEDRPPDQLTSQSSRPLPLSMGIFKTEPLVHWAPSGHFWVTGVMGWVTEGQSIQAMTTKAMDSLKDTVCSHGMDMKDLVLMQLYVRNMDEFADINQVYKGYFALNPPARLCMEVPLPANVGLQIACYGYKPPGGDVEGLSRRTMHVQGLSHWAPANIGPYSQAVMLGDTVYVAGQIGMVPANLDLVPGVFAQCRLSLQHVVRVLAAMRPTTRLHHVLVGVCYVTHRDHASIARAQYQAAIKESLEEDEENEDLENSRPLPIMEYVVIPTLPKKALVEWQVYSATCQGVHSGTLTQRAGALEAVVYYKYIPAPYHLLSYTLQIDSISGSASDSTTYQSALQLAYDALVSVYDQVTKGVQTENTVTTRAVQIFYKQGAVSEDQLRQNFRGLPSSPVCLLAPVCIPVVSLVAANRIMTWCS